MSNLASKHFLDRIRQSPAENTPKLIYADWLEDSGNPLCQAIRESLNKPWQPNTIFMDFLVKSPRNRLAWEGWASIAEDINGVMCDVIREQVLPWLDMEPPAMLQFGLDHAVVSTTGVLDTGGFIFEYSPGEISSRQAQPEIETYRDIVGRTYQVPMPRFNPGSIQHVEVVSVSINGDILDRNAASAWFVRHVDTLFGRSALFLSMPRPDNGMISEGFESAQWTEISYDGYGSVSASFCFGGNPTGSLTYSRPALATD